MGWADVRADMAWDGAWRDIYVFGAGAQAWADLLGALPRWGYTLLFEREGRPEPLPATFSMAVSRESTVLLTVDLGGIGANSHFFCEEIIEFDIDPREVQSEEAFERLYEFITRLGNLLGREVVLTHENQPEAIIVAYRPGASSVER